MWRLILGGILFGCAALIVCTRRSPLSLLAGLLLIGCADFIWFTGETKCESDGTQKNGMRDCRFHNDNIVSQKLLTTPDYCNTLIALGRACMANVLSIDKQVAIISALAEGSGIRQIERMTRTERRNSTLQSCIYRPWIHRRRL